MPSHLLVHITPSTVRVEVEHEGIVLEEDAAIALQLDAKRRRPLVLAVGAEASALPERLPEILASPEYVESPPARIVPLRRAFWWKERRLYVNGADHEHGTEIDLSPYANEIVILWPFAQATYDLDACEPMLRHMAARAALQRKRDRRFSPLRPSWKLDRTDVTIADAPTDPARHDALVRMLRDCFGREVWLNGEKAALMRSRSLGDLTPRQWLSVLSRVGAGVGLLAYTQLGLHAPVRATCMMWDPLESTCRHASLSIL